MAQHQIDVSDEILKAYDVALKAQGHSYSPYSHFPVGACLKFKGDDHLYGGCNVENASYGATICAERSALMTRISQHGQGEIEFLVVIANTKSATAPCALCLQALSEFTKSDFPVYMAGQTGLLKKLMFKEFLPHGFDTLYDQ